MPGSDGATVAVTARSADSDGTGGDRRARVLTIVRFDVVQRVVHWVNAALFAVLVFTGAALYIPALSGIVARRPLMARIHIDAGLLLPIPIVLALLGPWGAAMRRDVRRFNRWSNEDRRWLRLTLHRELTSGVRNGKFNAGQKLNAAWTGGSIVVMLLTGLIMRWGNPWPLDWRTGSTFVHQALAIAASVVIVGHIRMALADGASLRSMVSGRIPRAWAQRHAPAWLAEIEEAEQIDGQIDGQADTAEVGGRPGAGLDAQAGTSMPRGSRSTGQPNSRTADSKA
jgi:formate dehydrogenase gamma subunit